MHIPLTLLLFLVLNLTVSSQNGISVKDDLNNEFHFDNPPKRIITLAPNLTEFVYALRYDKRLIANTLYCNFPEEAKYKTKVGNMISLDFEKILSISPDLIFITVEGNTKGSYEKLISLGLKVFVSNPRNYRGIKRTLKNMALIFNKNALADSLIGEWDKEYEAIISENKKRKRLKGMFAVSIAPLMLAGKNTFMNEYLINTGIENIAASSELSYPIFNREEILRINPDVMIFTDEDSFSIEKLLEIYPEWKGLNAIKNQRVITVQADLYFRPGPRFIIALKKLSNKISVLEN